MVARPLVITITLVCTLVSSLKKCDLMWVLLVLPLPANLRAHFLRAVHGPFFASSEGHQLGTCADSLLKPPGHEPKVPLEPMAHPHERGRAYRHPFETVKDMATIWRSRASLLSLGGPVPPCDETAHDQRLNVVGAVHLASIACTVHDWFVLVACARPVMRPAGARLHGDTARAQGHLVRVRIRVRVRETSGNGYG